MANRKLPNETMRRELQFKRDAINEENRTVELAFSSEIDTEERYYGVEILEHGEGNVRLGRLNGAAPLLLNHDPDKQIGVVESANVGDDRKGRAVVRFGNGALATEVYNDVKDGIRQLVSVGYRIYDAAEEKREGKDYLRVTDWEPLELSIVSVPFDATVGVGREAETIKPELRKPEMTTDTKPAEKPDNTIQINEAREQARKDELDRVRKLSAIGKQYDVRDLADKATAEGWSLDQMHREMVPELAKRHTAPVGEAGNLDVDPNELKRYSIMNAIRACVSGNWEKAGFEREMSRAVADQMDKDARGFFVPHAAFRTLNTTTATGAAELVGTDHRDDLFIELLRANSVLGGLGVTMLNGLVGNVDIPKQTGASTFYWIDEDEDVTLSEPTTGSVSLSPKTVAGAVPMTRRLLKQSAPSVDQMVLNDLVRGMSLAVDLAGLSGTGLANQPTGISNTAGVGAVTLGAGAVTRDNIVDLETAVAIGNAAVDNMAYVFNATTSGIMQKTKVDAGSGIFLYDGGDLKGHRTALSNQVADDTIIFGDFSSLIMGMWGGLDIKPDDKAKAASDGLVLRTFQDVDFAVRNAESFAVGATA